MPETHLAIQRQRIHELFGILYLSFNGNIHVKDVDTVHFSDCEKFYIRVKQISIDLVQKLKEKKYNIIDVSVDDGGHELVIKVHKYRDESNGEFLEMMKECSERYFGGHFQ